MNAGELRHLQALYKALADDNRLRMVGYLAQGEYKVSDLAKQLGITEATVSHHIGRLRDVGLLNLRADGTQNFYRINTAVLATLKRLTAQIEEMPLDVPTRAQVDTAWIDALPGFDDEARKVLKDYAPEGHLTQIPRKLKKLQTVLEWMARDFEPGRFYTEAEINAIIRRYHDDYATLRRELIDFGYLRRERGGGQYWLAPADEAQPE